MNLTVAPLSHPSGRPDPCCTALRDTGTNHTCDSYSVPTSAAVAACPSYNAWKYGRCLLQTPALMLCRHWHQPSARSVPEQAVNRTSLEAFPAQRLISCRGVVLIPPPFPLPPKLLRCSESQHLSDIGNPFFGFDRPDRSRIVKLALYRSVRRRPSQDGSGTPLALLRDWEPRMWYVAKSHFD